METYASSGDVKDSDIESLECKASFGRETRNVYEKRERSWKVLLTINFFRGPSTRLFSHVFVKYGINSLGVKWAALYVVTKN